MKSTTYSPAFPCWSNQPQSPIPDHENDVSEHHEQKSGPNHEPFDQTKCLFCKHISSNLDDNLTHMSSNHNLIIPSPQNLVVDILTFVKYLHLIVFGHFECLSCGCQRGSLRAIQQHMIDSDHCLIDNNFEDEDSEFLDFYDIDALSSEKAEEEECKSKVDEIKVPMKLDDKNSMCLPSGKTVFDRSSHIHHRRNREKMTPRPSKSSPLISTSSSTSKTQAKALARYKAYENSFTKLWNCVRATDRQRLMHMPPSQRMAAMLNNRGQLNEEVCALTTRCSATNCPKW